MHFGITQNALFEYFSGPENGQLKAISDITLGNDGNIYLLAGNKIYAFNGIDYTTVYAATCSDCVAPVGFVLGNNQHTGFWDANNNLFDFSRGKVVPSPFAPIFKKALYQRKPTKVVFDGKSIVVNLAGSQSLKLTQDSVVRWKEAEAQDYDYFIYSTEKSRAVIGQTAVHRTKKLKLFLEHELTMIPFNTSNETSSPSLLRLKDGTFLWGKDFELIHFSAQKILGRVFVEKAVECLLQATDASIWVGLNQGGLLHFTSAKIIDTRPQKFFAENTINGLVEDVAGNIWISAIGKGLYMLPSYQSVAYDAPKLFSTKKKRNLQLADSLPEDSIAAAEYWLQDSLVPDSLAPLLFISSIKIGGVDTLIESNWQLPYNQNNIQIEFIGRSKNPSELLQYRYKMPGIDNNWIYTSYNLIQYTNLLPGTYQLQIEAMNHSGIWSENALILTFDIAPPFWKTWWFTLSAIFLVLLLVAAISWTSYRNIQAKIADRNDINRRIANIEMQALRAQMNPHFMFNTLSSIQHYITLNDTDKALRFLSKFAKLMRMIMDNSRKTLVPVKDEFTALQLYLELEKSRFKEKFEYKISIAENVDQHMDELPSMLIQPYVENAILHGINQLDGKVGLIEIRLEKGEHNFECTIEDNGIGREAALEIKRNKATTHRSQGMSITKDRLEILNTLHNSQLSVEIFDLKNKDNEATGTRVVLFIPFVKQ